MIRLTLLIAFVLLPSISFGQIFCPKNGRCPQQTQLYQGPFQQFQDPQYLQEPQFQMQIIEHTEPLPQIIPVSGDPVATRAACRVVNGNSCGSGSICGIQDGNSYVMTNAHVAGTSIGREVIVRLVLNNQTVEKRARVIMAAFSDRTLTDWAILRIDGFAEIEPVKLSTKIPLGDHYTRGSPRCVWPQITTGVRTVRIEDDSPLWRWTPNSIGGQSGSGVWSAQDHKQYGLLTWSWGGYGAGQQTAVISRQSQTMDIMDAPARIPGLEVLAENPAECEVGFFAEVGINELPIWDKPEDPVDPTDPTDPKPCPCEDITEAECELVKAIRKLKTETSDSAVSIDYLKLIALILEIVKLFSK